MSDPTETAPAAVTAPSAPVETAPAATPAVAPPPVQTPAPVPAASEPKRTNFWARIGAQRAAEAAPKTPIDPALASAQAEANRYRGALAASVEADLAALPESWRGYVRTVAGDDPLAARKAIDTARTSGLLGAALPAPASTAPAPAAPRPAEPADADAATLAEYERLAKAAPIRALAFKASNEASIARALKARPS